MLFGLGVGSIETSCTWMNSDRHSTQWDVSDEGAAACSSSSAASIAASASRIAFRRRKDGLGAQGIEDAHQRPDRVLPLLREEGSPEDELEDGPHLLVDRADLPDLQDRKSTRLNSS